MDGSGQKGMLAAQLSGLSLLVLLSGWWFVGTVLAWVAVSSAYTGPPRNGDPGDLSFLRYLPLTLMSGMLFLLSALLLGTWMARALPRK